MAIDLDDDARRVWERDARRVWERDARRVWERDAMGNRRYDLLALMAWAIYRQFNVWGDMKPEPKALENTIQWMGSYPGQVIWPEDDPGLIDLYKTEPDR